MVPSSERPVRSFRFNSIYQTMFWFLSFCKTCNLISVNTSPGNLIPVFCNDDEFVLSIRILETLKKNRRDLGNKSISYAFPVDVEKTHNYSELYSFAEVKKMINEFWIQSQSSSFYMLQSCGKKGGGKPLVLSPGQALVYDAWKKLHTAWKNSLATLGYQSILLV